MFCEDCIHGLDRLPFSLHCHKSSTPQEVRASGETTHEHTEDATDYCFAGKIISCAGGGRGPPGGIKQIPVHVSFNIDAINGQMAEFERWMHDDQTDVISQGTDTSRSSLLLFFCSATLGMSLGRESGHQAAPTAPASIPCIPHASHCPSVNKPYKNFRRPATDLLDDVNSDSGGSAVLGVSAVSKMSGILTDEADRQDSGSESDASLSDLEDDFYPARDQQIHDLIADIERNQIIGQ
ncbi:hypothetical protein DFH08DRAFT_824614 [Mycena albidolilacea]|uniref:Uncharacterized protein n=1 Tax=Mycena albidolilacea TaxID=1033008 RepID=A0AAD6Z412_9AGAR|nr:hypothetical protein DFH08DRAFT_824614 [Mycena albidolilacea]